ncbi:MAG: hypothetical protein ISR69_11985 [Gammaproteobacteria bacterium]|nr:hypothetical protein [Gammaproteobacteria bacterium]
MKSLDAKVLSIITIIFALAAFRLVQFIPNVTPIAAMALFAGAHFSDKKLAFVIPFAALLISDLILGLHSTMLFVYAAFALTLWIGMALQNKSALFITLSAIGSSLLFFLITNTGVWLMYNTYSAGLTGLIESYVAGIPFYKNTLAGDLVFSAVLFGGYALLTQSKSQKQAV